jgi:hypothetical protein
LQHLLLGSLDGGLGNLTSLVNLGNGLETKLAKSDLLDRGCRTCLDDADGDGLSHVTDSEAAERRIVGESLDAHRLGWHHLDDSGIS